jgi:hypothetical protein
MKALAAKMRWNFGWLNPPEIMLLLDEWPEMRYRHYADGMAEPDGLYYSENAGAVSFLYQTGNQRGFGGRIFDVTMVDNSQVTLHGPWSGDASNVNITTGKPYCVHVITTTDAESFTRGYTLCSSHVTVPWLQAQLANLRPDLVVGVWRNDLVERTFTMDDMQDYVLLEREGLNRTGSICFDVVSRIGDDEPPFAIASQHGDELGAVETVREAIAVGARDMTDVRDYSAYTMGLMHAYYEKYHKFTTKAIREGFSVAWQQQYFE